ncbi:MAG: hypothetical protein ACTHZ5_12765 [Micrococcaceae bacterium]
MTADSSTHLDAAAAETADVVADLVTRVEELSQELLAAYGREEILIKQVDALQTHDQQTTAESATAAALQGKVENLEAQNADLRFELSSARVAAAAAQAELQALRRGDAPDNTTAKSNSTSQGNESTLKHRYRQLRRRVARVVRPS